MDLDTSTMDLPPEPTECNICGVKDGVKTCPCWKVGYCSTQHQKEDRKNHEKECYPALIRSSEEFGKYLVATRDIKAGQRILKEVPLLVGPTSSFGGNAAPICLSCCSVVNDGYKCGLCQWPVCGLTCEQVY